MLTAVFRATTERLTRPSVAAVWVFGFLSLMLVLQVALQTGGRNDDAELMLFGQTLDWGYDPRNPPLIAWIGWAGAQVFGPGLLVTRLVVLGLIGLTYLFLYRAARLVVADRQLAVLAALTPMLTVHFGWYPFINLTHTISLICVSAATVWALLALLRAPGIGRVLLLGLVIGLGLLTKYNYVILLGALLVAALGVRSGRAALLRPSAVLIPIVAVAIAAPHYLWFLDHLGEASNRLQGSWSVAATGYLPGVASGLAAIAESAVSVLMPAALILIVCFPGALAPWRRAETPPEDAERVLWVAGALVLAVFLVAVIGFRVTNVKVHHMMILLPMALPAFARVARFGGNRLGRQVFSLAAPLCALLVVAAYFDFLAGERRDCGKCGPLLPYADYAAALADAGFDGGTVVLLSTVHRLPAEQLLPWFPDSRFLRPEDSVKADFRPPRRRADGDCLVIWNGDRQPEIEQRLRDAAVAFVPALPDTTVWGRANGTLSGTDRPAPTLAYALVPGGIGECR